MLTSYSAALAQTLKQSFNWGEERVPLAAAAGRILAEPLLADRNKDGKVELLGPTSEITQQNDYYPFGMRQEGDSLVFHQELSTNRYRYNGKELNEEIGHYFYGFRMYDPVICRFTGVDPIADQFAYLSTYNYASNDPIANVDLHGLQGVRYSDTDANGVTSHRVGLDIRVVTVDSWNKKENGKKPRDRVSSSYSSADVKEIRSVLNYMFNGEGGEGRLNSDGERVVFDFNVSEFNVGEGENVTLKDLRQLAREGGTKVGTGIPDGRTGLEILSISADNFMVTGASSGGRGENKANITTIRDKDKTDYTAVAHETGHQLMTSGSRSEHRVMSEFGFRMSPALIDAILNDALDGSKKQ